MVQLFAGDFHLIASIVEIVIWKKRKCNDRIIAQKRRNRNGTPSVWPFKAMTLCTLRKCVFCSSCHYDHRWCGRNRLAYSSALTHPSNWPLCGRSSWNVSRWISNYQSAATRLNLMQITSWTFDERQSSNKSNKRSRSYNLLLTEITETVRLFSPHLLDLFASFDYFICHGTCVVVQQTGRRSVPRDTQGRHLALTQSVWRPALTTTRARRRPFSFVRVPSVQFFICFPFLLGSSSRWPLEDDSNFPANSTIFPKKSDLSHLIDVSLLSILPICWTNGRK